MNRSFPALRGIAIILVILNHTIHMGIKYPRSLGLISSGWEQSLLYFLAGLGIFAVPIFLYLSGCFFSYAAQDTDLRANYKIVWVNLGHILFPYLIWSIVFFLEVFLVHGQLCTPGECVKNLLVGYPYNFVPLLIFFYLIAPLLILVIRRMGWVLILVIAVLQLALLNLVSPGVLGFEFPGWMSALAPPVLANSLAEWAIFFPLGLIYVKVAPTYLPLVRKFKWILAFILVGLYILGFLDILAVIHLPIARYLCPFFFILLAPIFNRNAIPSVKTVENLGKRAYGLYFMNLIVLDLIIVAIERLAPGLLTFYYVVLPLLFILAIQIPILIMKSVEMLRKPAIHRYVFG
jgi:peptidoglycan/LPS O-acetylase OafA/YrhL